jgi:hypothetical protein
MGVMVFIQGWCLRQRVVLANRTASNISMLTTVQGVIADDLDAFESASWFTSAYLVRMNLIVGSRLTG